MHIKINRDFETAYKDELFRGMSTKETMSLAGGAVTAGAVTFIMNWKLGVPVETGIYAGVLCALPILAAGFTTIQGLTPVRYLKEMHYAYKTRLLTYSAGEIPSGKGREFTMKKKKPGKRQCPETRYAKRRK